MDPEAQLSLISLKRLWHLGELGRIGGVPGESIGEGVAEEEEPLLALLNLPLLLLLPPHNAPAQESGQGRSRGHHALPTVEEEKAGGET